MKRYYCFMFVISLVMLACTHNSSQEVNKFEACELLLAKDAEKILGGAVGEPNVRTRTGSQTKAAVSNCSYSRDGGGSFDIISLLLRSVETNEVGKQAYDRYASSINKTLGEGYALQPVENIGEAAGWSPKMKQLSIFVGPNLLILSLHKKSSTDPLEELKPLAQDLLQRLK